MAVPEGRHTIRPIFLKSARSSMATSSQSDSGLSRPEDAQTRKSKVPLCFSTC